MFIADGWQDFSVLDCGGGEKLERWGSVLLIRPDPQAIWPAQRPKLWKGAQARYLRSETGGGNWEFYKKLPERWEIGYGALRFFVRPTGFKHTGLFPEQAANWEVMGRLIRQAKRPVKVLNLFAYTGGATLACAAAGAAVTHVGAAKSMVGWAKENAGLSGLLASPIRYIVDDCLKFVLREQRRGSFYDGIVMDPPSYGRGADGQVWKMERDLYPLVEECAKLLSREPLFFFINSYTTGLSGAVTGNMLKCAAAGGELTCGELMLPIEGEELYLPCGTTARLIWK